MATELATHRLIEELRRTLDHMSADLDRVETLTSALQGFAQPVPDYDSNCQSFSRIQLSRRELRRGD